MFLWNGRDHTRWKALDEVFSQECKVLKAAAYDQHLVWIAR